MKTIKILFVDFWKDFNSLDNFFINRLSIFYNVVIDSSPDYLFYSTFGYEHLKYKNCIKIYFTGENDVPDFNFCDYAIGFQHIVFEDRYLRYPLYLLYDGYDALKNKHVDETMLKRKFCNFVYSNSNYSTPQRESFFNKLSLYKKVDSGGRLLNNVGGPVKNKLDFIKNYKFTIAFENSCLSGYTTEKLMEPMVVNSLPIYWGNPTVQTDFNPDSIINLQDYSSFDEAIEEIIHLDNDDSAYLQKLSEPWQTDEQYSKDWQEELTSFLCHIFDQSVENAIRKTIYGYVVIKKYKEARYARLASMPILRKF